jgi:hypothetical protein
MPHGTASRSAHRAAGEGGLALPVWPSARHPEPDSGTTGQHRHPRPQRRAAREPQRRAAREPQRRAAPEPQRTLQALTSGLGALIVLGICGLTGFFIVADERRADGDVAAATRSPEDIQRIRARATDPRPLSLSEVFPAAEVRPAAGTSPYKVGMVHIDSDCGMAATGQVGAVLDAYGCSQVVRADITAPFRGYEVTAGIFNLVDAPAADRASAEVRQLVESGGGTFAVLVAGGPGTDPLAQPPAQAGWHERGHYLVYCVIARLDGELVHDDDPYAEQITGDLVQSYLGDQIIGRRALGSVP